jgi:hypothetical protein
MIAPRRLAAVCVAAGTLALPAAASAMPIDNGPPPSPKTAAAPPPVVHTVVESSDDTLPIAVAGVALLVAMTSAGYSIVRLAPLRAARRTS